MSVDKKKLRELYESIVLEKQYRIYVHDKSAAPEGAKLQRGERGGIFYYGSKEEKKQQEAGMEPIKNITGKKEIENLKYANVNLDPNTEFGSKNLRYLTIFAKEETGISKI